MRNEHEGHWLSVLSSESGRYVLSNIIDMTSYGKIKPIASEAMLTSLGSERVALAIVEEVKNADFDFWIKMEIEKMNRLEMEMKLKEKDDAS